MQAKHDQRDDRDHRQQDDMVEPIGLFTDRADLRLEIDPRVDRLANPGGRLHRHVSCVACRSSDFGCYRCRRRRSRVDRGRSRICRSRRDGGFDRSRGRCLRMADAHCAQRQSCRNYKGFQALHKTGAARCLLFLSCFVPPNTLSDKRRDSRKAG